MEPKKNPNVDLERKKTVFFLIGLFVSLSVVYIAINFRFYEANADNGLGQAFEDVEEEIIPITQQNTPPPPRQPEKVEHCRGSSREIQGRSCPHGKAEECHGKGVS